MGGGGQGRPYGSQCRSAPAADTALGVDFGGHCPSRLIPSTAFCSYARIERMAPTRLLPSILGDSLQMPRLVHRWEGSIPAYTDALDIHISTYI